MPTNKKGLESRTNGWMVGGIVLMAIGILAFPIYRVIEPTQRAEASEETQNNLALAGESLWTSTCAACHGSFGQGVDAPALNSVQFLTIASNEQILSIVSSGIPGSEMAAYGQQFGGPLTQEQIVSIVACIRSWEETAPDRPDWRDIPAEGEAGHDEAPADEDGDGADDHDEAPADGDGAEDHDEDGADDHDEVAADGPPACGPEYDAALFGDHDEDGEADHDE